MEGIPGELHIERLPHFPGTSHESLGALRHPEQIDRIGIGEGEGLLVAGVAVMVVVAMLAGPAAAEVPLSVVGRRIAGPAQQLADRHRLLRN